MATDPRAERSGRGRALLAGAAHLIWPALALALLLAFNAAFTPGFFHVEIRDGRLYGTLVDILNHGSRLGIVALGMTLVIATSGVDLSVGAVMAIAGAVAATMVVRDAASFPAVLAGALATGLAAGLWNGWLVSRLRIQPIVATLVLMVAGRGIAQLVTDGLIITTNDPRLAFIAGGSLLGLPLPVTLAAAALALLALATRKSSLGLFLEAVGDNETASRYAGLDARGVVLLAYAVAGVCAALAGLIEVSYIRAADANNAGLFVELDAILAVVIGGTALTGGRFYLVGSLLGALFIQTLTKTMYMKDVSADVASIPKAIVVILVCLLQSPVVRGRIAARRRPP
ncbi:MAG: Inner membrane ABC transporter permease protein YtfT [Phycisphaerae bacterium]|nr:Inner membrane ABC transporter permease protein YtfT [Phycisphaerae bacterium]